MSNDQPSPYSTAAVEATVDHLRARIRELEADLSTARRERDAYRDSALSAESTLRQGSDALAHILGRDDGLPLSLHIPSVRIVVAGLHEAMCERDDLRNLTESLRVCAESSTGIAERYTDKYKELHDAARAVVEAVKMQPCDICGRMALVVDRDGDPLCEAHAHLACGEKQEVTYAPAWRHLCALVKP